MVFSISLGWFGSWFNSRKIFGVHEQSTKFLRILHRVFQEIYIFSTKYFLKKK